RGRSPARTTASGSSGCPLPVRGVSTVVWGYVAFSTGCNLLALVYQMGCWSLRPRPLAIREGLPITGGAAVQVPHYGALADGHYATQQPVAAMARAGGIDEAEVAAV